MHNDSENLPTPSGSFPKKQFLNTISLVFFGLIVFGGYYIVYSSWDRDEVSKVEDTIKSYGLDAPVPVETNMSGGLFFSANRAEDESDIPEIYNHNFDSNTMDLVFDKPAYSYSKGKSDFDIAIGYLESSQDHDGYQPVSINKETEEMKALPNNHSMSETDLTFSPDNQYYAYSFKTSDDISNSLSDWNVVIYNFEMGELLTISSAAEPEFINDGRDVVYMTNDGLFAYNLSSKKTLPVTTLYQNLTIIDDYAISNDSSTLVITLPSLNMISVSHVDTVDGKAVFKEVGIIKSENVIPRFPVISPDNKFYAVMAAHKEDFDETTSSYKKILAEIRFINNSEIIQLVSFENLKPQSVVLEEWTTL